MHAYAVSLLLVAAALAGCTAGEPPAPPPTSAECLEQGLILNRSAEGGPRCEAPPFEIHEFEDPRHHCVVTRQRDRVHAPDLVGTPWALGQWWDYETALDGETQGVTRMVYFEDQDIDAAGIAHHYMVGTAEREDALRKTLLNDNPMIGRVHRILYSPHESGDHADMFHFPLCEGSTWTTMFYAETFTLTARKAEIPLPGRDPDDGFLIEGASAEGSTLRLSYSPAAQWFTFIDLQRGGGGSVALDLVGLGGGYRGDAYFLRGQQESVWPLAAPALLPVEYASVPRGEGGEGPYDTLGLLVDVGIVDGTGLYEVALIDPDGVEWWGVSLGGFSGPEAARAMLEVPWQPGEWTLRQSVLPIGPLAPNVEGEARIVSLYDRSGSV